MSCTAEGLASTKAARLDQIKGGGQESSVEEVKCNGLAETFASELLQSSPHLKERLPLLRPVNEYGVEKFICTFLKPTLLPYPELFDLQSCASFVANFIQYEPLQSNSTSSLTVVSPAQTLDWAVGDCFDCSFLLVSLLIGAGFDAFVVCGTAPDWLRLKDQSHMTLALQSSVEDGGVTNPRRVEMLIEDKNYAQQPSQDDGMHCWLLVKAGKRGISTTVFVEPSTGGVYPCDDSPYYQVHSVCNDKNCWVNTGDGTINESGLDCTDSETWRPVLPGDQSAPFSWVRPLDLPKERYEVRYPPDGKRTITLDRCKVVLFGKDVDPQGIVSQVYRYEDTERLIVVECEETYCSRQREDHLLRRTRRPLENQTHELFSTKSNIIERMGSPGMRSVAFREKTRSDGLVERREEIGSTITEHFRNRSDGLVRREVHLSSQSDDMESKKTPKPELIPLGDGRKAAIERIDEHFDVPTGDLETSVASRSYLLQERCIKVKYQCEHPVLQKEDSYRKDDLSNGDSLEKELLKLESASVSEVKRTQAEMVHLDEAKYGHETSTLVTEVSQASSGESNPTANSRPGEADEKDAGATFDYLSPYLQGKGPLTKEDALQVKKACLDDNKDRMLERAKVIQSKLEAEKQRLSEEQSKEGLEKTQDDVHFRIEVLQKRLDEHESRSIAKYQELESRLKEDIRLASLHEDDE